MSRHWNFLTYWIKVMHLQLDLSLEYYGHEYFVPNHHNLILWESLACYMFPVMANHLSWYDTVLLPPTGYVKTLLEFLIQHSSHKSNKKVSSVVHWLVVLCKLLMHTKKNIISHQAVWRSNVSFFFLIKWFNDFRF